MKRKTAPWARIKANRPGIPVTYRERKKSRKWMFIFGAIILSLLLTFLRIPERLGLIDTPEEETAIPSLQLTGVYKSLLAEITDMEQDADWDGDGLKNGADLYPRDIDADKNGISDGFEGKQIINGELPVGYRNTKLVVSNSQSGIVYFRGDYFVSSFAGWIAFAAEAGTPYLFDGDCWAVPEYEAIGDTCYVNVPGTCRIHFSETEPNDRDVLLETAAAEYDNKPDERYSIANAPLSQLEKIYSSIDNGRTVQISILTEDGEQLLLVHGYDRQGNLIVANTDSFAAAGKVEITVKAQVFWDGEKITMRSWFDFTWGELSSLEGDALTLF